MSRPVHVAVAKFKARARLRLRILRSVTIDAASGCWLWTKRRNNQGYPVMSVRVPGYKHPRPLFAHRVALEVFVGPPQRGHEAAHAVYCPHPHCVKPAHLRWATREENEADKRHPTRLRLREVFPPAHSIESRYYSKEAPF